MELAAADHRPVEHIQDRAAQRLRPVEHRRERGDSYNAAARHLANRYFGILFHCLQNRLTYDETKAFPTPTKIAA